jgi:hypothetical protein
MAAPSYTACGDVVKGLSVWDRTTAVLYLSSWLGLLDLLYFDFDCHIQAVPQSLAVSYMFRN